MHEHARGLFITVEGIEGVGKSTHMALIAGQLDQVGIAYVQTREPGGTPLAESIRDLLLQPRDEQVAENTELLLMFAARAQHIDQVIEPALKAGKWVLCDRFTDATFAYQGGGRGIPMEKISALEQWVQSDLRPDYTILLDAPVQVGLERANKRGALDRFEQEQQQFFDSVRAAYLDLSKQFAGRYRLIDASETLPEVKQAVTAVIEEIIASQRQ